MFYDIYLDELFYFKEDEKSFKNFNIFSGLLLYDKNENNKYKNGKITILNKEKDLFNFIKMSRNVLTNKGKLYYGKISNDVSNKIESTCGYSLKNFNLSLQVHNIKHIIKKHSNPFKEFARGQVYVTDNDFGLIPYIISSYDKVEISQKFTEYNNKVLIFKKEIQNITYNVITYISFRNHNLEIKTMFKNKKKNSSKV